MIRRPPRSTQSRSSAASDVYKRQVWAGVGDAHAGPHRHEDEEQENDEAQEAGEAAPAKLAPAGPAARAPPGAARCDRAMLRRAHRRGSAIGAPRAHLRTSRRWRGTTPLSSLPHSRQRTVTSPLQISALTTVTAGPPHHRQGSLRPASAAASASSTVSASVGQATVARGTVLIAGEGPPRLCRRVPPRRQSRGCLL